MLVSLGHESSALGVARWYGDLVSDFVIDEQDRASADAITALGTAVHVTDTIMGGDAGRARLGGELLRLAGVAVP
jgi:LPPG:FO 2-phospho-L-lactate transferase